MRTRTIAVITFPYLYTSVIAEALRSLGSYAVDAPDLLGAGWDPRPPYDVVITSLPVPPAWGRAIVQLPDDFNAAVEVSIDDLTVRIDIDHERPIEGLLELVRAVAGEGAESALLDLGSVVTPAS